MQMKTIYFAKKYNSNFCVKINAAYIAFKFNKVLLELFNILY